MSGVIDSENIFADFFIILYINSKSKNMKREKRTDPHIQPIDFDAAP